MCPVGGVVWRISESLPPLRGLDFGTPFKPSPRGLSCSSVLLQFSLDTCQPVSQSVQSLRRVWLFATPWTAAHQSSLSITNSRSLPNSCALSRWCHPSGGPSLRLLQGASETRASGAALGCFFLRSSGHHDILVMRKRSSGLFFPEEQLHGWGTGGPGAPRETFWPRAVFWSSIWPSTLQRKSLLQGHGLKSA